MIIATNNKGKIREIKEILDIDLKSLSDAGLDIDVVEDQESFYGNASKKAKEIYNLTKEAVIADDSGLCINVLDGFPGVFTHRFLGEEASDEERNIALINKLDDKCDRKAQVVCNIVYYDGINELVGVGILEGNIALEPRGNYGFGFDSIFELKDGRTLAELRPEEKNIVSARYLAIKDLRNKMKQHGILY